MITALTERTAGRVVNAADRLLVNGPDLPPYGPFRPTYVPTPHVVLKITGAAVSGLYPAVVETFSAGTWSDNGSVWAVGINGEALASGTRYSGRSVAVNASDGKGIFAVTVGGGSGNSLVLNVHVFTANGTWTKPANLMFVELVVVGGGGAGGNVASTSSSQYAVSGGGGAGGYAYRRLDASSLGATESVTVGAAGIPGLPVGGTSSFGSWASATGGSGGSTSGAQSLLPSVIDGGVGGVGSSGDINAQGEAGEHGILLSDGVNFSQEGGRGGSSLLGGGAQVSSPLAGYGQGGGGKSSHNGGAVNGASGTQGIVTVYEWTSTGASGVDAVFTAAGPAHAAGDVPDPGGTGHTPPYALTDDAAFHKLLGAKGDLLVTDGTGLNQLAAGTNGFVLTADSTQTNGVKWAAASASAGVSSLNALTGALTLVAGTNITVTPSGANITIASSGAAAWPAVNTSFTNPTTGTSTDAFLTQITTLVDHTLLSTGFTNSEGLQWVFNPTNGLNAADQSSKTTYIALDAGMPSCYAAGQRFVLRSDGIFYGMGDAFNFIAENTDFYGGVDAAGDEGQGALNITSAQPTSVVTTTINTVYNSLPGASTTLTQAVTGAQGQQTVTVASTTGMANGDYLTVNPVQPNGTGEGAMEVVGPITVVSGTQVKAPFTVNQLNGAVVRGATVLTLSSTYQFGQHRFIVNLGGVVTGTSGLVGGSGYSGGPFALGITGGGGTGAAGTYTTSGGAVNSISITAGGSGYTSLPTLSFPSGGGTGASANALVSGISSGVYNTGTASVSVNTVTGVGTAWTAGMVGGSTTNIGVISFAADDVTAAPWNTTTNRLRAWYPIISVTNGTSLFLLHKTQVSSTDSYGGLATSAGAYTIRPGARIWWYGTPGTPSLQGSAGTVVLPYNTFTWHVNDTVECVISPDLDWTGCLIRGQFYTPGGTYRSVFQASNNGLRTIGSAYSTNNQSGVAVPFNTGLDLSVNGIGTGINLSGSYGTQAMALSKNGGANAFITWGTPGNTGLYFNDTNDWLEVYFGSFFTFTKATDQQGKIRLTGENLTGSMDSFSIGGHVTLTNAGGNGTVMPFLAFANDGHFTTTVQVTQPTAARTVTIPNAGGTVHLDGYTSVTSAYTATVSDDIIACNVTGAPFSVTLPAANGVYAGKRYTIKKVDVFAAVATVAAAGSDKIDGAATYALSAQYKYVTVASDGSSNWWIVANN